MPPKHSPRKCASGEVKVEPLPDSDNHSRGGGGDAHDSHNTRHGITSSHAGQQAAGPHNNAPLVAGAGMRAGGMATTTTTTASLSSSSAAAPQPYATRAEREAANTIKFVITTDNHLGFLERDPRRGDDSFVAFEEVLRAARVEHAADAMLLGGDLFHLNKPSLGCLARAMTLLRRYALGRKLSPAEAAAAFEGGAAAEESSEEGEYDDEGDDARHHHHRRRRSGNGSSSSVGVGGTGSSRGRKRTGTEGQGSGGRDENNQSSSGASAPISYAPPAELELLSDPASNFPTHPLPLANFQDPNLRVALPIFSIHGNHDDPVGGTSSLDLLAAAGLINYFGHTDSVEDIVLKPILMRKGGTFVALYGLGCVRDERLHRCFQHGKVRFQHPAPPPPSFNDNSNNNNNNSNKWFKILILHQNRGVRGSRSKNGIHESFLAGSGMDLVVWGNEHEQQMIAHPTDFGFAIIQPGSTVRTSLGLASDSGAPKQYGVLEVRGTAYRLTGFDLQYVRPAIFRSIVLRRDYGPYYEAKEREKQLRQHNGDGNQDGASDCGKGGRSRPASGSHGAATTAAAQPEPPQQQQQQRRQLPRLLEAVEAFLRDVVRDMLREAEEGPLAAMPEAVLESYKDLRYPLLRLSVDNSGGDDYPDDHGGLAATASAAQGGGGGTGNRGSVAAAAAAVAAAVDYPMPVEHRFGMEFADVVANPEELLRRVRPSFIHSSGGARRGAVGTTLGTRGGAGGGDGNADDLLSVPGPGPLVSVMDIRQKIAQAFNRHALLQQQQGGGGAEGGVASSHSSSSTAAVARDQRCALLSEAELATAVYAFAEKGETSAIDEKLTQLLSSARLAIWQRFNGGRDDTILVPDRVCVAALEHKLEVNAAHRARHEDGTDDDSDDGGGGDGSGESDNDNNNSSNEESGGGSRRRGGGRKGTTAARGKADTFDKLNQGFENTTAIAGSTSTTAPRKQTSAAAVVKQEPYHNVDLGDGDGSNAADNAGEYYFNEADGDGIGFDPLRPDSHHASGYHRSSVTVKGEDNPVDAILRQARDHGRKRTRVAGGGESANGRRRANNNNNYDEVKEGRNVINIDDDDNENNNDDNDNNGDRNDNKKDSDSDGGVELDTPAKTRRRTGDGRRAAAGAAATANKTTTATSSRGGRGRAAAVSNSLFGDGGGLALEITTTTTAGRGGGGGGGGNKSTTSNNYSDGNYDANRYDTASSPHPSQRPYANQRGNSHANNSVSSQSSASTVNNPEMLNLLTRWKS